MYDYLKGYIIDKKKNSKGNFLTLEVTNIGYLIEITEKFYNSININDENLLKIYICLLHKEDYMKLFGFISKEERDIFKILISVSGVGAKMAIALLNEFDYCDLISFVVNEKYKELVKAKGVGIKLAQKIILELKDKLLNSSLHTPHNEFARTYSELDEVIVILESLGYNNNEIQTAIGKIPKNNIQNLNTEELLKNVLTILSA